MLNNSTRWLNCLVLLVSILLGCGKSPDEPLIVAEDVTRAETKLLSELSSLKDHLVQCPISISNTSQVPQTVKLVSTGCSCYGVIDRGKKVARGESITLPAGETVELLIEAQAPLSESLQSYRAKFEFPTAGEPVIRELHCEMQVYQDIKIFPRVLICDTEQGDSIVVEKQITVERIFRSEYGESPEPQLNGLPADATVAELVQQDDAVEIESGIWKAIWLATLQVSVSGDLPATGTTSTYTAAFPQPDSPSAITSNAKIIQRVRVPVHYPREVHFGRIPQAQLRKRSLFLSSVDGGKFILRVQPSEVPTGLDVSVPEGLSDKYKIDLTLQVSEVGDWKHDLVLETDLDKQPKIIIPLKATILDDESI